MLKIFKIFKLILFFSLVTLIPIFCMFGLACFGEYMTDKYGMGIGFIFFIVPAFLFFWFMCWYMGLGGDND